MSSILKAPLAAATVVCALLPAWPCRAEPVASASPLGVQPVDLQALARERGGSGGDPKLNGVVSDNRASNLVTGSNFIGDGALAGVSGVPMVVQNSGNNVLIQSATIINVQIK